MFSIEQILLLRLHPLWHDRAQVSHAETAFYLPANEHVTIYVTSPAWIRIEAGDPAVFLDEIATVRLSDTWYGPNTREGELCYANHTFCRTHLQDVVFRPHRVVSPVLIYNHSKSTLLLEEVTLPHLSLSIYTDKEGIYGLKKWLFAMKVMKSVR